MTLHKEIDVSTTFGHRSPWRVFEVLLGAEKTHIPENVSLLQLENAMFEIATWLTRGWGG